MQTAIKPYTILLPFRLFCIECISFHQRVDVVSFRFAENRRALTQTYTKWNQYTLYGAVHTSMESNALRMLFFIWPIFCTKITGLFFQEKQLFFQSYGAHDFTCFSWEGYTVPLLEVAESLIEATKKIQSRYVDSIVIVVVLLIFLMEYLKFSIEMKTIARF